MTAAMLPLTRGVPEEAIVARARSAGLSLPEGAGQALAAHAAAVLDANPRLHLTTITDPAGFLERHLGESFEGAALLEAGISGTLVDLGSGNGYPALPIAAARPGLHAILVEASTKKAAFLRGVLGGGGFPGASVIERQVRGARDLAGVGPVRVLSTRAASGWETIVPRIAPCLEEGGIVLVWAGEGIETVRRRVAWRALELIDRRALPGRQRSWVVRFVRFRRNG